MTSITKQHEIDIKSVSVYNFLELLSSNGTIAEYFSMIPECKGEYFSQDQEKSLTELKSYKKLQNTLDKTFSGK